MNLINMKRIRLMTWLLICCLVTLSGLVSAGNKQPIMLDVTVKRPVVEFISGVVYSQPSSYNYKNFPLKMDIMKPNSKELLPAVVFVPGGGFISANKDKLFQEKLDIAQSGYVVASIEYRVAPQSQFPAPLEDVKAAVRYLRANAKRYGIDPQRIAVMGNSAGGYLAALTGTTNGISVFEKGDYLEQSSSVQAVIDLFGLSDLTKIGYGYSKEAENLHYSPSAPEGLWVNGMAVNGPGGGILDYPEKAAKANPITYITKDAPPFLVMVGDKDVRVSPNQSEILHEALINKGADSTFYVIKDAGHGGPKWVQPQVTEIMIDFLHEHLKAK